MLSKVLKEISNINGLSKKIIKYGSFFSYLLLICGVICINLFLDRYINFIGEELIKTSVVICAEFIIFGLLFDLFKRLSSKD
jgi:hypothetical protein